MSKRSEQWKALERKVARLLGGQRTFNTGSHGGVDVEHPTWAIECKYRKAVAFKAWFDQAKKYVTKKNQKIPLLVVKTHGQIGEYAILKLEDLVALIDKAENNTNV